MKRPTLADLKTHWITIAVGLVAIVIALEFLGVVLQHTTFGLPIEDAYIYLTYAKQFGRLEPFTYFNGGGYSAGATSPIWPMILAPFWALGARGGTLVWVSFFLCTALYASTCILCSLLVRRIFGAIAGGIAACCAIAIAPFAFTALSGMEVALASTLLFAALYQLYSTTNTGPPTKKLAVTLAALALSRPEATLIVTFVVIVHVALRLWKREWRAAAWWLAPMLAPLVWVIANRIFAGHFFPNTGVAKSHFYLPGFDWTYWWDAVTKLTKDMVHALFVKPDSPFVWPDLISGLWTIGAFRVLWWAHDEKKWLVGILIVLSPIVLLLAVVATSGQWAFHNYRYIAAAFPLIMATAACAIAPPKVVAELRWPTPRAGGKGLRLPYYGWVTASLVALGLFAREAYTPMRADMDLYAQTVSDLNTQVVRLGQYIHDKLPDARIMFHDAGAIAYYGDRPVYDMLGLVTNHQADVANHGPGARFEFLESIPPERRPTHFAYYPSWMGQNEFFGEIVMRTPLRTLAFHKRRMVGDYDMQLLEANWDHVHTAERPFAVEPGWNMVDRIDIADVGSEKAHGWSGEMGRRHFAVPTARWSLFHRDDSPELRLDGGRTIRGRSERFTTRVDPSKPVRLILRTGGKPSYPYHEAITKTVAVSILGSDGTVLSTVDVPPPLGRLAEVAFEFRSTRAELEIVTRAAGPYRAFHWFVLQPN